MTHDDQQERTDALEIDIAGIIEERDQLRARVAELEEREKRCATMDDAEKHALFRGLQEIAVIVGDDDPSPASITKKVAAIVARVAELEAFVKIIKSTGICHE